MLYPFPPTPPRLRLLLGRDLLLRAIDVGNARQDFALRVGWAHRYTDGKDRLNHTCGAISECACGALLNRPWHPQIGEHGGPDLEGGIECRCRVLMPPRLRPAGTRNNFDLGFRKEDEAKKEKPFILTWVYYPEYVVDLVGWCYGKDGIGTDDELNEKCNSWFMEPKYLRSASSLVREFALPGPPCDDVQARVQALGQDSSDEPHPRSSSFLGRFGGISAPAPAGQLAFL